MNAVERARKATGLSIRAFAELVGANPRTVSRWESGALKMNGAVLSLMRLVAADPARAVEVLRAGGEVAGFAGDGGPPPSRSRPAMPDVDAWGHPTAEGAAEPDLGWEPGEDVGVEDGDFYAPDFDGAEGQL